MSDQFCGSLNLSVAVLLDFDNTSANQVEIQSLMTFAGSCGEVVFKRAYADWTRVKRTRRENLYCKGIRAIDVPSGKEKSRADRELIQDCRNLVLYRPDIKTVILLSKDSDFVPLVNELKAKGKTVIVITQNPAETSCKLKAAASEYYCFAEIEQWFSNLKVAA